MFALENASVAAYPLSYNATPAQKPAARPHGGASQAAIKSQAATVAAVFF